MRRKESGGVPEFWPIFSVGGGPKTLAELFGTGCCISGAVGGREKGLIFLWSEFRSSINLATPMVTAKV